MTARPLAAVARKVWSFTREVGATLDWMAANAPWGSEGIANRRRCPCCGKFIAALAAFVIAASPVAGAPYEGTIDAAGYHPPNRPITVTWRRPGAPDVVCSLDRSQPFVSPGDASVYARYGGGCSAGDIIGRQITAIGAEQLGGRAWLILRDLYRDAGIDRLPCGGNDSRCSEVYDFAIVHFSAPPEWCDFVAIVGRPDPVCGSQCATTRRCRVPPAGAPTPTPAPTPSSTPPPPPPVEPTPTPPPAQCCPPCQRYVEAPVPPRVSETLAILGGKRGPLSVWNGDLRARVVELRRWVNQRLYVPGVLSTGRATTCAEVTP
ncbi:MAG TPA: hypothetical protein VD948_05130 [Rhodothermales bacterium]|nr:hypothetical protein [Rhodothermales bacterium]